MAAQGVRKTFGGSLELTIYRLYTNGTSRGAYHIRLETIFVSASFQNFMSTVRTP